MFLILDLPEKTKRQNLLFSATFSEEVKAIANKLLNNYYFCSVSKDHNADDNIEQIIVQVDENDKVCKLHEILQTINGSVLSKLNFYYLFFALLMIKFFKYIKI